MPTFISTRSNPSRPTTLRLIAPWVWLLGLIWVALFSPQTALTQTPASAAADEAKSFTSALNTFLGANYAVARQFFADFVKQFPMSERVPEAILYQARAALKQDKPEDCIALLEGQLANSGKVTDEYQWWLGEALFQKGDPKASADRLALMLKNHPNSSHRLEASYGEARARFKLGDWDRVVTLLHTPAGSFRTAAKDRSNDELVIAGDLMLIEALLQLRNYTVAEGVGRSLTGRNFTPDLKWRYEQLRCRMMVEDERLADALKQSTNAVIAAAATGTPAASAESLALQAVILTRLNRLEEAAQVYQLNLTPTSPALRQRESLVMLIQLQLVQNNFSVVTQRLEQLMSQSAGGTNSDVALLTYGEVYLREYALAARANTNGMALSASSTNLLAEAIGRFDHLIRVQPSSPLIGLAHLNRAWCLWASARLPESQDAFRSAAATLPFSEDQAVAQFKLGETQFRLKDYTNALASFGEFTNRFSRLPRVQSTLLDQALIHLVRVSFELHDTKAATDALERLLAWKPQSEFVDPSLLLVGQRLTLLDQPELAREWLSKVPESSTRKDLAELIVGITYTRERRFTNALEHYTGWLSRFTNSELIPRAQFNLAQATYHAGQSSNAYILFTNFLSIYPTNTLAPLAQYEVGEFHLRQENYTNAEIQFQRLYENTNWPINELTYRAKMQAGRSAFARKGFNNARLLFSQILNDKPAYPDLVAQAYFAYGDCLMMEALGSTNVYAKYGEASTAFGNMTRQYTTNEVVPKAWGNLGNCYLQLAHQEVKYYYDATNAFQRVLSYPNASVSDRSQALVGIGIALLKLAETYSTAKEQQTLSEQAQVNFLRVLYEKNLMVSEKPDPFWQKKAGFEAAQLAESSQDWDAALGIYDRLKQILPALAPELDRRIARIKSRPNAEKP